MSPKFRYFFAICIFSMLFISEAYAQKGTVDASIGFGAAQAGAASTGISASTLNSCSLSSDADCIRTPSLSSFMLGFDGTAMIFDKLGVNAEVNFQPRKQDYVSLSQAGTFGYDEKIQSRITFYDFNAVYRPVSNKRALLQLVGGIGGANVRYYDTYSSSSSLLGSSTDTSKIGSVNKFQLHGGIGVQIYLKDGFFIRPQFDLHYVPGLDRYSTNLIKRETIWLGYTFGK